ncbi:DUF7079 family protein [Spongiivirga citrea]
MKESGRKQLWIALSNFYLDTELQNYQYLHIADVCKEIQCSFEEAKEIDRTEVFPVLYKNLLSVAGVWDGFDEEWLVACCSKNQGKKDQPFFKFKNYIKLLIAGGHFKENWKSFDQIVNPK